MPVASIITPRCRYVAALLLLTLLVSGGGLWLWPAPAAARTAPIAGNMRTLPPGAQVLGPLAATHPLRLAVGLALRHESLLTAFLALRAQRSSPLYGRTLTPAQFVSLFGPKEATEEIVSAYLRGYGLRVVRGYQDRLLLDVAGTAGQVEAAFGVSLVSYRDRHGHVYYANAAPPRLPVALARLVTAVVGLRDDMPYHHTPQPRALPSLSSRSHASGRRRPTGPGVRVRVKGPMPRAAFLPPATLLTPLQIRTAYDITPIYSQVFTATTGVSVTAAITGAGQTVALYELSPYRPEDIATYDAAFGLAAAPPISVPVNGGATDTFDGKGTAEAALDIELVQAVAPGAQILVYNGPPSLGAGDNTGADDIYARIVNDDRAQVLSTSWGQCEDAQQADNPPDLTIVHDLLMQAVAEGMTVVGASGDDGAYDCTTADGATPDTSKKTVDYPASDPVVLAVGGTTLTLNGDGTIAGESGWPGSGGGYSAYFARPDWQTGPGLDPTPGVGRAVPDVALNATNYAVWVAGGWQPVNGTSGGPPVWAALLALVNQARYVAAEAQGAPTPASCAVLPGLGDIHAQLYQLAATPGPTPALRDITTGLSNGAATPGPGWDAVTGWGVPDAYTLLRALIAMPSLAAPTPGPCPTLTPTPLPTPTATALRSPRPAPTRAVAVPLPTATPTARPGRAPGPKKGVALTVQVLPSRVHVGGTVLLAMRGAAGRGHTVTFAVLYSGHTLRRVVRKTDAHGAASARVRIPTLPRALARQRGPLVVQVRVTVGVRRRTLSGWTTFRLLPKPAKPGGRG